MVFNYRCSYLLIALLLFPAAVSRAESPTKPRLEVTDNLSSEDKELTIETNEWKVVFSLYYNGGIYQIFDKVFDPAQKDNLVTGPWYSQGGIFDYDVYLQGDQEFSTALGKNDDPGRASLQILENTPVRLRLRQKCRPRLNNGDGPPNDKFIELDMVDTTTDWTFYPTGRVNIKFDAVVADDWTGLCSTGPGGDGPGITADGNTIHAVNSTSFLIPWITRGDMLESKSAGWGPVEIAERLDEHTLRLTAPVPAGTNLDFTIRRPYILDETISIHADGDPQDAPRKSYWQGGSNGVPVWSNGTDGDLFRPNSPPLVRDYVLVHWTRTPRGFATMLALNEPLRGFTYGVFNDLTWRDISYTQVARRGWRPFEEHHRNFMAQLATQNAESLPSIKSVAEALPFADDYLHPFARAVTGTLLSGPGISEYGFHVPTGSYHIVADANIAAIAFDAMRAGSVASPLAYYNPAILVSDFDVPDDCVRIELSKDAGSSFEPLTPSGYNLTTRAESTQLGSPGKRLFQLLTTIPETSTGPNTCVLRFSRTPEH